MPTVVPPSVIFIALDSGCSKIPKLRGCSRSLYSAKHSSSDRRGASQQLPVQRRHTTQAMRVQQELLALSLAE
jgi:hypothetical protein